MTTILFLLITILYYKYAYSHVTFVHVSIHINSCTYPITLLEPMLLNIVIYQLYVDITSTTRTPAFWDTPAAPWLPILVIHIRSQVEIDKVKVSHLKKFTSHATHILQLLDKIHKYETDPTRTEGATKRTRDARRTDGTDNFVVRGYNYLHAISPLWLNLISVS